MSVETPSEAPGTGPSAADGPFEPIGAGWLTFAGLILAIGGTMNVIGGIGAIDDANFYVGNAQFLISDLSTWGWVLLITGAAQVLTAFGLWARNQFARWLGVGFASLNSLAQLLMIPAYPLWSLALFTVDILIIYGLIVYGGRTSAV